jgi:hypothetical protein
MQHKETKTCREVKNRSQTSNIPGEAQEKTIAFPRLRDRGDDHPPTTPVDDIALSPQAGKKASPTNAPPTRSISPKRTKLWLLCGVRQGSVVLGSQAAVVFWLASGCALVRF